jgi:hypothetical protein
LLGWLLNAPLFASRDVEVAGANRVSRADVVAAAQLERPGPVFALQPGDIRQRLVKLPWVRDARARVELPDRVVVEVTEWQPVAMMRAGAGGEPRLLNERGVVLGAAAAGDRPLEVVGPAGRPKQLGERALDPELLATMIAIQGRFPEIVQGEQVTRYEVDGCGNLVLDTKRGWKVYFGRLLTAEEFAGVKDKLSALRSVAVGAPVEMRAADLEYVNVMNPSLPALHRRSDRAPAPAPAPTAAAAAPTASPAAGIQVQVCR